MRIGIDAQSTVGEKTGIGVYASHLLRALYALNTSHTYIEYKHPTWTELNTAQRILWENILLPCQVAKTKPDVLFVPGFAPPLLKLCPTVAVLQDLIGVLFPHNLGFYSRIYWSRWLPWSIRHADFIVCNSAYTCKDGMRILRTPAKKMTIVYPGGDSSVSKMPYGDLQKALQRYGIRGDFILSVGTIEPRKNFVRLIEAWSKVCKEAVGRNVSLVIVGKKGWGWPALKNSIDAQGLQDSVRVVGYVDEQEKELFYRACSFFVFPSLYEGFGLPVLEAMSFGKAVIASNSSSIPEVTGNAALFVDPYDVKGMADAIVLLMKDQELRNTLAIKGAARVPLFSWEKAARSLVEIFERVAGGDRAIRV